jgi:phosphoglycolate phosphatase-like HAD superfamily hydrolase
VLDFDGVLIDSEPEVSSSAVAAASARWPDVFSSCVGADLSSGMRDVRPVLVNGYEAMVMARLLAEAIGSNTLDAVVASILADWPALLSETLARWGEDAATLAAAFEAHRAAAINNNNGDDKGNSRLERWLALNQAYPGIPAALAECPYPFYITTSKAASRVSVLCEHNLGLPLPPDSPRLMCALLPPNEKKIEALR